MPVELPCVTCGAAAAQVTFTEAQAMALARAIASELPLGIDRVLLRLVAKMEAQPGTVLGLTAMEFAQAFGVRCIACVDGGPAGGPYTQHSENHSG